MLAAPEAETFAHLAPDSEVKVHLEVYQFLVTCQLSPDIVRETANAFAKQRVTTFADLILLDRSVINDRMGIPVGTARKILMNLDAKVQCHVYVSSLSILF